MSAQKNIWLPKSETKVTVDQKGRVNVWDEMVMELKPISSPTGFSSKPQETDS